jgi:tRNA 2-selenouridine synthase
MSIKKLSIQEFLEKAKDYPVFDVRSPGEYIHAQIPRAFSLPLFSDEERKVVGTAYKQQGKQQAIKIGLDYFGVKMRGMVEQVEKIVSNWELTVNSRQPVVHKNDQLPTDNAILVHCWRGGMRSAAVAWLLDLYGYEVYTLVGGYKAYRNWVLSQFEKEYEIKILGGYTGSGKTIILHQLENNHETIIDLEKLANHKGSAFGGIGQGPQPSQEMFENLLAMDLSKKQKKSFWLEDESQRIGKLHIPNPFWINMRRKPVFFVDIPFHERLQYILQDYGKCDIQSLQQSIERIQKRLGPLETKTALAHLHKNEIEDCFGILLLYYDKHYKKGLQNRENINDLLNKIPCSLVDSITNADKLVLCSTSNI